MNWTQAAALIVPIITLVGAIITVAVTYTLNQRAARRERLAKAFTEALTATEDYAQMPYRIRRRLDTPEARYEISVELNKIQSQIAFQHAWLHIESVEVARAYDSLIRAARNEAGSQMKKAWATAAPTSDEQMTLETAYPRGQLDSARSACITAMRAALGRRHTNNQEVPNLPR